MTSLDADAKNTREVIDSMTGPTVVAGHSYGGAVITAAERDASNIMASRAKATTISLPSSHASLVSHPREVANLILEACKSLGHV